MSDLSATNCGCGCERNERSGFGNNSCLWIILLLFCCGGCGNGFSGNNNGCGDSCIWIILLLFCCGGFGSGSNNGCGCSNGFGDGCC